ncbi:MAG TPA: hypothetical protein VNZ61_17910 [Roseomonas sp.]|nr:hypothetical protein [Roseomonas sp.]
MELNILVRGQSNALVMMSADDFAGANALVSEVQRLLGFDGVNDRVNLIYGQEGTSAATVHWGVSLMEDWLQPVGGDWTKGWQVSWMEQAMLNLVGSLPATQRDDPTAVLWLHSEHDSMRPDLTAEMWMSAVRYDAGLLRDALGQSADTVPYHFVSAHPFPLASDTGHQIIRAAMETLAADPGFNGQIAARALDINADWDDADGNSSTRDYGGRHISDSDALLIAHRAAQSIAESWAAYAKAGSPVASAGGNIDDLGPLVVAVHRIGPASLQIDVRHDSAAGFLPLDADAASGLGWSVQMADGSSAPVTQLRILDGDSLRLDFGTALSEAGGTLHYGWGYGRLAAPGTPGQGNAIYDDQGLPIWTPAQGVAFEGSSPVPPLTEGEALAYIASYSDLANFFGTDTGSAKLHYTTFGKAEGRHISFNGLDYVGSHADLFAAFGADPTAGARHWIEMGRFEGRTMTFDCLDYVASYEDLIQAFGTDQSAALNHWMTQGRIEGRSTSFNALEYIASYDDLTLAFGVNADAGAIHWILNGRPEERSISFDALEYIASHPDLIPWAGLDSRSGVRHWLEYGRFEGRVRDGFDATQYLANYADLQQAFGQDHHAARVHYIEYGFREGRTDDPTWG